MTKRAYVVEEFDGRPDDEPQVRKVKEDEVISGDLAEIAVKEGWAKMMTDEEFEDYQEHQRQQQAAAEEEAEEVAPPKSKKAKKDA